MNTRYNTALQAKLRRAIQREQLFGVYRRRSEKDQAARKLASLTRLANYMLAALSGGLIICILILTGVIHG